MLEFRCARKARTAPGWVLLLFVLAFGAAPLYASDEVRGELLGIQVRAQASYRWPELCHRGWVPVKISIENYGSLAREIDLRGTLPFSSQELEIEQSIALAPGETRELEWLVPLFPSPRRDLSLRLESGFHQVWMGQVGPSHGLDLEARAAVVAGPRETASAAPYWLESWKSGRGVAGEADDGKRCDWVRTTYAELPFSMRALSSLDLVILDAEDALPEERVLDLLARHVAAGGTLAVLGEIGAEQLPQHAAFAGAFEPRFERARAQRVTMHSMGLGLLLFGEPALDDLRTEECELLGRAVAAQRSCVPVPSQPGRRNEARGASAMPKLSELGHLPVREILFVLLGFAVLIGPLNFWFVQRLSRPVLLLVTVPLLSLCFGVVLLGITFAREGFSTRIASRSLTVLDQREQRRATVEWRAFYSPLTPGTALSPRAGTALHLAAEAKLSPHRLRYLIDAGSGALAGAYLPSRRETRHVAIEESACAERLVFERQGAALRVANLLGVTLRALEVYDSAGERHVLAEPLAPGASASLAPASEGRSASSLLQRFEIAGYGGTTPLRIPSELRDLYAAELDAPPWLDRGPLQGAEIRGEHLLFGTLALGAIEAR
ncbi:MAG: hypothetical protein JNM84_25910 [Planctomycetes bacterium]|nr:hypothetical protein [Planctomycetota bacterium]